MAKKKLCDCTLKELINYCDNTDCGDCAVSTLDMCVGDLSAYPNNLNQEVDLG